MVHPGLIVLGAGIAIGLLIFGAVYIAEQINEPNQPYSQRSNPPRQNSYRPSPDPSPNTRRPASNTEMRHRATSPIRQERADRATSPIGTSRHFADECSVCQNDRRAVVSFQPCGDFVMCRQCAEEYLTCGSRYCPQCRHRIQRID